MYRLLIADDEKTIREGLKKLIQSFDLNLEIIGLAKDGKEALQLITQYEPEIILLDINMPYVNGLEVVREIKELTPLSKTIIISGYDDFEYAQQALEMGVFNYLLKPIDYRKFKEVLEKAMLSYQERLWEVNQLNDPNNILVCDVDDVHCASINYIKTNYRDNNLNLKDMAEDLFVSTSYLTKIIKEQTGSNFTDYVNTLRLESAKSLLKNTNHSIKDIAEETGFSSQHYFSRIFKKHNDMTPLDYRNSK